MSAKTVGRSARRLRSPARSPGRNSRQFALRVGFVPLIDAAPLIAAAELGYFADEGLEVSLSKQIGWGNVRDRLTYGELHASHAPLPMVPASVARLEHYDEPFVILMGLNSGGNAITVRADLARLGDGKTAPAQWSRHLGRPVKLAYVFSAASHNYLLRRFLHLAGVQLEQDAHLCVLPPTQLPDLMRQGIIDGYCVGEPWNTVAVHRGCGTILRATTELAPNHPEKVLAVTRKWAEQNPLTAERLVRATLRGCDFCEDVANRSRLTEMLAADEYLAMDEKIIHKSLTIDDWLRPGIGRPPFQSFGRHATAPRLENVQWITKQMVRWGTLLAAHDIEGLAARCIAPGVYERAVDSLEGAGRPGSKTLAPAS